MGLNQMLTRNFSSIRDKQGGWVFIDSLIGIVIVATALTALMFMYTQATKTTMTGKTVNNAIYVAQRHLEDIKQYDGTATITALPTSVTDPPLPTNVDGIDYTVKIRLIPDAEISETLNSKLYPYEATVSWTDNSASPSASRSIKVTSYYFSN